MTTMHVTLDRTVPFNEAEDTLRLARLAVESIYGPQRAEFDAPVDIDRVARTFIIDVSGRVGKTLALVFTGYARREFGPESVVVEHAMSPRHLVAENA